MSTENSRLNTCIFLFGLFVTATTWLSGIGIFETTMSEKTSTSIVVVSWLAWIALCIMRLIITDISILILRPIIITVCILLIGLTIDNGTIKTLLYPANHVLEFFKEFLGSYRKFIPSAGKIGHVVVFFALTLILFRLRTTLEISGAGVILLATLIAHSTESIQLYVPSRTTSMQDLIYDCLGIILAIVWYMISHVRITTVTPSDTK